MRVIRYYRTDKNMNGTDHAISYVQGGSKKTFSRPAGLSGTFSILRPALLLFLGIMSTFFHSFRVWHALFRVSDPPSYFFLALCQPFTILYGSGSHFFCSGTRFLLLYGSNTFFFLSQTHVALPAWHYVNLFLFFPGLARAFSTLGPDFRFYTGLKRSFSILRPAFLLFLGFMSTFSHSFRVWHALFLLWDPLFTSIRVWHALFPLRDPILLLCGSGTRFFLFGTRV